MPQVPYSDFSLESDNITETVQITFQLHLRKNEEGFSGKCVLVSYILAKEV
jgi:hypothetical protein